MSNPTLIGPVNVTATASASSTGTLGFNAPAMLAPISQLTYPIIGVASAYEGAQVFTVAKGIAPFDGTRPFQVDEVFRIVESTGNDGFYTVVSVASVGDNWEVTVAETITDLTADGKILVGLALYIQDTPDSDPKTINVSHATKAVFPIGLKFRLASNDPEFTQQTLTVVSASNFIDAGVHCVRLTVAEDVLGIYPGPSYVARLYYLDGDPSKRYKVFNSTPTLREQAAMGTDLAAAFIQGFAPAKRARNIVLAAILPGETLVEALEADTSGEHGSDGTAAQFYGFTTLSAVTADLEACMTWAETAAGPRVYWAPVSGVSDPAALYALSRDYSRTLSLATPNPGQAFAWEALCEYASIDPDQASVGFPNAVLPGLTAGNYTAEDVITADANRVSIYGNFMDTGVVTYGGYCANGYPIDLRVALDWAAARLGEALARVLKANRAAHLKIPFTDGGISSFRAPCDAIGQSGYRTRAFVDGSWSTNLPLAADVPTGDKAIGKLVWTCSATYATSIGKVDVTINVSADL